MPRTCSKSTRVFVAWYGAYQAVHLVTNVRALGHLVRGNAAFRPYHTARRLDAAGDQVLHRPVVWLFALFCVRAMRADLE